MKYIRINKFLNINSEELDKKGIHNGFLLSDSCFYVDPEKLLKCNIPEFKNFSKILQDRMKHVLSLLKNSKEKNDLCWKAAYKLFTFTEPKFVALGLGVGTIEGKGLSGKAADDCLKKMKILVDNGYDNSEIIYALSVFNDNIGTDKTSDLICNLLEENILLFTKRVLNELGVDCKEKYILYKDSKPIELEVMYRNREDCIPLALLPKEILSPIPRIVSIEDISLAIEKNDRCKRYLLSELDVRIKDFFKK